MNSLYDLPESLVVNGIEYSIRTDFRAILDILIAFNDPDLSDDARIGVCLRILYKDFWKIPQEDIEEAINEAFLFIDCGMAQDEKNSKPSPRLVDWEKDAKIIISAVNKTAKAEIRAAKMHWWTFMSYYMEIGETYFSEVVSIRKKLAEHKKLESYEKDFYKENRSDIDLNRTEERSDEEKEALRQLWGD